MPRDASTPLPQPVFNEGNVTPDPSRFNTTHPTDGPQYKALGNLLKKDVVSFDRSRAKLDEVFTLQSALGPHGPEIIQKIKTAAKIVFHSAGAFTVSGNRSITTINFTNRIGIIPPPSSLSPATTTRLLSRARSKTICR